MTNGKGSFEGVETTCVSRYCKEIHGFLAGDNAIARDHAVKQDAREKLEPKNDRELSVGPCHA